MAAINLSPAGLIQSVNQMIIRNEKNIRFAMALIIYSGFIVWVILCVLGIYQPKVPPEYFEQGAWLK